MGWDVVDIGRLILRKLESIEVTLSLIAAILERIEGKLTGDHKSRQTGERQTNWEENCRQSLDKI